VGDRRLNDEEEDEDEDEDKGCDYSVFK